MDLKKTGLFISGMRKEKSMTQKELAERLSVTDKAVSRWETGKRREIRSTESYLSRAGSFWGFSSSGLRFFSPGGCMGSARGGSMPQKTFLIFS